MILPPIPKGLVLPHRIRALRSATFRKIKYPLTLPLADKLGVTYDGVAYDAGKAASLPGFALSLNAEFQNLNQNTFDSLLKAYCGWSKT